MHYKFCKHQFCAPLKSLAMLYSNMSYAVCTTLAFDLVLFWFWELVGRPSSRNFYQRVFQETYYYLSNTHTHKRARTHIYTQTPSMLVYVSASKQLKNMNAIRMSCTVQFAQFHLKLHTHTSRIENPRTIHLFARSLNSFALQLNCRNVHFF